MRSTLLLLSATIFAAGQVSAESQSAPTDASQVQWTPVNAPNFGFRTLVPCSEEEISAYQEADETRRSSGAVGCEKKNYTAIAMVLVNTPAGFFEDMVTKSKTGRMPPNELAGHRLLRTIDQPKMPGEAWTQFVELGEGRHLLLTFEQKSTPTPQSRAIAVQFFNSVEIVQ